jgi:snapalysin
MAPIRRLAWRALAVVALALALPALYASPAAAEPQIQVRTIMYDASRAGEFVNTVHQAAQVWNSRVTNVRLVSGTPASITVHVDNGWPRAYVTRLGVGRFYMGRQAVNQGYFPLRIATHEFGHLLGLPDRRTGLCSDLMSGSSAPVSCRNAQPSSREASQVQANFAGSLALAA